MSYSVRPEPVLSARLGRQSQGAVLSFEKDRVSTSPARTGFGIPSSSAITPAVSTMRFEKPHSFSYQLTTRTSSPLSTEVSRLSTVEQIGRQHVCTPVPN